VPGDLGAAVEHDQLRGAQHGPDLMTDQPRRHGVVALPDDHPGVAVDAWGEQQAGFEQLGGQRPQQGLLEGEVLPDAQGAVADPAGVIGQVVGLEQRLYPVHHLIAYRGLRRGEAVGLRWEDVDLDAGYARISQQVVQLGWATEVGEPKTDSGSRTVSLDAATVAALRRWRAAQAAERRQWGKAWTDTGLVFTREDGSQLHPDLVISSFERICRAAGLPPIRLHDLRHTAASLALQAGVPLKVVSEQLGHSSLAITADTYTSVLPAVAQAAAEAVAGIIPRAFPGGDGAAALAVGYLEPGREPPMRRSSDRLEEKAQVGTGAPRGV